VSEPTTELILVNTRLVLTLSDLLARSVSPFSRVTPPPSRRLLGLQFVQALPFLGGNQDDGTVTGADESYRPVASLYLVGDGLQRLRVADRLLFHTLKYAYGPGGMANTTAGRQRLDNPSTPA
jgi:hypothetical protein